MEIVDKLKERIAKTELRKKEAAGFYFFIMENQQVLMEGLLELLQRPAMDMGQLAKEFGGLPITGPSLAYSAKQIQQEMESGFRCQHRSIASICPVCRPSKAEEESCWMPPELAQGPIEKVVGGACVTNKD